MSAHAHHYDLIVACDVLIYCGQLEAFFSAAQCCVRADICSSPWNWPTANTRPPTISTPVVASATSAYLEGCLRTAGLQPLLIREESLRVEMQQAVPGLVVLARH
jgi:predicted TPR repeat methyltransferase